VYFVDVVVVVEVFVACHGCLCWCFCVDRTKVVRWSR